MDAIRQHGARRRPIFADPVTTHLIRTQFNWSYLCDMPESKENWEQKRWCEAFDLAAKIHKDLVQIEVSAKVGALLETVGKEISSKASRGSVPVDEIRAYKEKMKNKIVQDADDYGPARIDKLHRQAQEFTNGEEKETKRTANPRQNHQQ